MSDRLAPLPRRLLGVGMIVVVLAILGVCVAAYNRAFTTEVPVTVRIAQVDNSFLPKAEVRMHGVPVGEVDKAVSDGDSAVLTLALDPDQVPHIPANVRAMILPKSLFGESFLSLEVPPDPSTQRIAAGDEITRDRSSKAVQTEQVFTHLLPLLEAVRPADLASTLGALNQALDGRGGQLGATITQLHQYLARFNTTLPDLTADIRALPGVTETYSEAAPDLIEGLHNAITTTRTIDERSSDVEELFTSVTGASDDLREFLQENDDNIINLVDTARPTLELLERYSPEYVCLFQRLADAVPLGKKVFGEGTERPALKVDVVITATRGKYVPHQDEPEYTDKRGPKCYPNAPPIEQYPGGPYLDGSTHPPAVAPGSLLSVNPFPPATPLVGGTGGTGGTGSSGAKAPVAPKLPMLGSGATSGGATSGGATSGEPAGGSPPVLLRGMEVKGR